jgi:uncharacterized protein (TIGR00725 family)
MTVPRGNHLILKSRIPIAVIGGAKAGSGACKAAEQIGRELAAQGYAIICGGRTGVMKAVCRGAAKGISIGILPTLNKKTANKHCTIVIPTNLGSADDPRCDDPETSRNLVVVAGALCVFAIGGTKGTANELKIALHGRKRVFGLHKPPEPQGNAGPTVWNARSGLFTLHLDAVDALTACGNYLRKFDRKLGWSKMMTLSRSTQKDSSRRARAA